jgi:hypothetical protein
VLGGSMKYDDGSKIHLGDIVRVPTPDGDKEARVVMLGDSRDHLDLDPDFIQWVVRDNILASTSIFVEWLGSNPFAHKNPKFAPVGNYMSTTVDEHVHLISRAAAQLFNQADR